jgi:hypothetical protein
LNVSSALNDNRLPILGAQFNGVLQELFGQLPALWRVLDGGSA